MASLKTRENQLRQKANRQGMRLVKSARRDPDALDYGRYHLAVFRAGDWRPVGHIGMTGGMAGMTVDDVDAYLRHDPETRAKWPRVGREAGRLVGQQ
jgi:hypothetical protein